MTKAEAARIAGVTPSAITKRMKKFGCTAEEAAKMRKIGAAEAAKLANKRRANRVSPSVAEMCRKAGIDRRTYYDRIRKYGWAPDEALSTPVMKRRPQELPKDTELEADKWEWIRRAW